jgi:2-oxoglutarate/2-oxoacid ferredoxin oxidoreductase subunit beta
LVSTCPTWWQKTPLEATEWLRDHMLPMYPPGVFKDWSEGDADA